MKVNKRDSIYLDFELTLKLVQITNNLLMIATLKYYKLLTLVSLLFSTCFFGQAVNKMVYSGKLIEAITKIPVSATLSVVDVNGNNIKPDNVNDYVYYLGKKRWYIHNNFSISTARDTLIIEIRRGLETYPIVDTLIGKSFSDFKTYELVRWTGTSTKNYMSGDVHTHFSNLESVKNQMKGEDLNVVNVLLRDSLDDLSRFTGGLDPISSLTEFIYVGQEYRDNQLGHINFMNPKKLVEPINVMGGHHLYAGKSNNIFLTPAIIKARELQSTIVWSHFSNMPGLESVIDIPLGLIDAIELMTWDDPHQLPTHQTAWDYSQKAVQDFPILRGPDLYYQYLNAGFQLPITAGTDKLRDNIPLGSNRHYIKIEGEQNIENWVDGLTKGQGFITNGPILEFSVNGHSSGEVVDFQQEKKVTVAIKAQSLLPFVRLEIVANGKLVGWKIVENFAKKKELYSAQLTLDLTLNESTWIAGRVTSPDTPGILPRNLRVFAHTNPVYFLRNAEPVKVESSVNYLLNYMQSAENWIEKHANFNSQKEKEEAMEYLNQARTVLRNK